MSHSDTIVSSTSEVRFFAVAWHEPFGVYARLGYHFTISKYCVYVDVASPLPRTRGSTLLRCKAHSRVSEFAILNADVLKSKLVVLIGICQVLDWICERGRGLWFGRFDVVGRCLRVYECDTWPTPFVVVEIFVFGLLAFC